MIDIPDNVLASMKLPEKERLLKVELAISLYQRGFYPWARRGRSLVCN